MRCHSKIDGIVGAGRDGAARSGKTVLPADATASPGPPTACRLLPKIWLSITSTPVQADDASTIAGFVAEPTAITLPRMT
jgi:hypothetical protein